MEEKHPHKVFGLNSSRLIEFYSKKQIYSKKITKSMIKNTNGNSAYTSNNEMLPSVDIEDNKTIDSLKLQAVPRICQCCLSTKDLMNMEAIQPSECTINYSKLLFECFSLKPLYLQSQFLVCVQCIQRLNEALKFRRSIEEARTYLLQLKPMPALLPKKISIETNIKRKRWNSSDIISKTMKNNASDENETTHSGRYANLPYKLNKKNWYCETCNVNFLYYRDLVNHMPEHHPRHICDVCGKICATKKSLTFHSKTHLDIRHKCGTCPKAFKSRFYLKSHEKTHQGEKIAYKCSKCKETFSTYNNKVKHLVEQHGQEDKLYRCAQCPSKYRLGSHLRSHVRSVHLQEKNHVCPICSRAFFLKKCLVNHSVTHTGLKLFQCVSCSKSFARKHTLTQHMKTHAGQKNFVCHWCGRAFTQRCTLLGHLQTHGSG